MTGLAGLTEPSNATPRAKARRLALLQQAADRGGTITAVPYPQSQFGYAYQTVSNDIENDLAYLTERNYLEARFCDRVSLCPKCGTHHINVREVCPSCRSAYVTSEGLLHHFRCGYVGIPSEFLSLPDGGYKCPKCGRTLRHPGTEFDRLGRAFVCRGCGVISENPPVEALCLSCGAKTPSENLVSTVIFNYVLTSRGATAVRAGSLLDDAEEPSVEDAPILKRTVILEFLEYELKRLQQLNGRFSLILAKYAPSASDTKSAENRPEWLTRLKGSLREVDLLGQLADELYIVLLPQMKAREAEVLRGRIEATLGTQSPFTLSTVQITQRDDLAKALAGLGERSGF
jgi:hypothetical protein